MLGHRRNPCLVFSRRLSTAPCRPSTYRMCRHASRKPPATARRCFPSCSSSSSSSAGTRPGLGSLLRAWRPPSPQRTGGGTPTSLCRLQPPRGWPTATHSCSPSRSCLLRSTQRRGRRSSSLLLMLIQPAAAPTTASPPSTTWWRAARRRAARRPLPPARGHTPSSRTCWARGSGIGLQPLLVGKCCSTSPLPAVAPTSTPLRRWSPCLCSLSTASRGSWGPAELLPRRAGSRQEDTGGRGVLSGPGSACCPRLLPLGRRSRLLGGRGGFMAGGRPS